MIESLAPQTDSQGNPLPAQGAAPGAAPAVPGIIAGTPDLATAVASAFMQHLTQNQPPPVSSVVQKQQSAAQKAQPIDEDRPAPAPGSFGSKLAGAASDLAAGIGDASHAQDSPNGGWLSAISNTAAARQQRLANAESAKILHAKTQAETVALHRNLYQQKQAIRDSGYKGNQAFVDTFKVNHDIEDGITHTDLMNRANSDPKFADNYYVRATGEEPVLDANGLPKEDKEGNPITSPTYTLVTRATKDGSKDDKTVAPAMAADMGKFLGSSIPANTKLTNDQYAALDGQLNLTRNAVNILQDSNEKEISPDQMKSLQPYLTDPTIQAAISHVPGSAYAGLLQYENNADLHLADLEQKKAAAFDKKDQQGYDAAKAQIADLTTEKQKVQSFMSQAILPKQIERYNKESEDGIKWVDKVLHDPASLSGDKASSVIPQLQEALKTETDPGRKMKLTSAINAATQARDNYFGDMDRKAKADQMAKQGDPKAAAKELVSGNLTLADLKTRGTTADFILQATQEAHRLDSSYNPADEVNFEHVAKSPQAAVFFGSARSLLSKGGTLDQLNDWGNKIPDNGLPTLNTVDDWIKLKEGKGPLAGYAALVLGAADDYGKVMGGGSASDSARDAALHLFAAAQTREQRLDAIRGTLGGVGSQYDARIGSNKFLQREYGNFARSGYAPASENKPVAATTQQQPSQQQQPKGYSMDVQRPKDLPTATSTKDFKNGKTGATQTYWTDISGKPLRPVAAGELPKE